jgi:hypothetical protein
LRSISNSVNLMYGKLGHDIPLSFKDL